MADKGAERRRKDIVEVPGCDVVCCGADGRGRMVTLGSIPVYAKAVFYVLRCIFQHIRMELNSHK